MGYHEMAAERESEGRVKKLSVQYMPWEKEGQSVIGKLVSENVIVSRKTDGTYKQYVFHTDEGMLKFQCGSYFDNEQGALMERGGIYLILFKGKRKIASGNSVNDFEVVEIAPAPEGKE